MAPLEQRSLRVLVANEDRGRLEEIARVALSLGHDVVAREIEVRDVAEAARDVLPDVAVVGLHDHHGDHALQMIAEIVGEGICPVIAVTGGEDPDFVEQAAQGGIFAYTASFEPDALRGAFDIAMRRFGQAEQLEGALARRAVIERAKGVLMERYSVDERAAFEMLRDQSRQTGEKVVAVSQAMLHAHPLLREPARAPAD
jgi:AmiR/NasT family two-component response regulator